jgi:hypothetical protein
MRGPRWATFVIAVGMAGCAFAPVTRVPANRYYARFQHSQVVELGREDAMNAARSSLEAIGFEMQSVTPELGIIRTRPRVVMIPEVCDCGSWNGDTVHGTALSSMVITVKDAPAGPRASLIEIDHSCVFQFTGHNLYGGVTREETYACASRGGLESEFWQTLKRFITTTRGALSPPYPSTSSRIASLDPKIGPQRPP